MHEHHRNTPGLMRMHHEQPFAQIRVSNGKVARAKTGDLEVPNRGPFQSQGEGGSGFVFDRNFEAFDLERPRGVLSIKFEFAVQLSRSQCRAWIVEPRKRRHRDLQPGWNTHGLFARVPLERLDRCGESRADARGSVAIAQTAHREVCRGNKILHAKAAPYEIAVVEFNRKLAEGQLELTPIGIA